MDKIYNSACNLIFFCLLTISTGCTSIKTSQLFRATDGKFAAGFPKQAIKGVPCKFKVQSGIRGIITETLLIDTRTGDAIVPGKRIFSLSTEDIHSDQVFLVHIPRPFAGTLDLSGDPDKRKGYHFNREGYLVSLGATIDDKTIQDITQVVSSGLFSKPENAKKTAIVPEAEGGIDEVTRVIATREFSYSNPNWHVDFNDWINQFETCNDQCVADCPRDPSEHAIAAPVVTRKVR
jgi:hypothetical protein